MLQLAPLPGSPRYRGEPFEAIAGRALDEAQLLVEVGFDGLQLQNMGDGPGTRRVGPETIASMTAIAKDIRTAFPQTNLSILVNWDGVASIAVAAAVGADFVRIEHTFVGACVTAWGLSEACCHDVMQFQGRIQSAIPIAADVLEPHGTPLVDQPVAGLAAAAVGAGAAVLYATGRDFAESIGHLRAIKAALPDVPLVLGGGATPDNVGEALTVADGVTVANWIKGGDLGASVDRRRAVTFMDAVRQARDQEARLRE